jgi:hypothetical protein
MTVPIPGFSQDVEAVGDTRGRRVGATTRSFSGVRQRAKGDAESGRSKVGTCAYPPRWRHGPVQIDAIDSDACAA